MIKLLISLILASLGMLPLSEIPENQSYHAFLAPFNQVAYDAVSKNAVNQNEIVNPIFDCRLDPSKCIIPSGTPFPSIWPLPSVTPYPMPEPSSYPLPSVTPHPMPTPPIPIPTDVPPMPMPVPSHEPCLLKNNCLPVEPPVIVGPPADVNPPGNVVNPPGQSDSIPPVPADGGLFNSQPPAIQ